MKIGLVAILFIYSTGVLAHGDHSAPGALPFAPHGGKVGVAEDEEGHDEHGMRAPGEESKEHADHEEHKEGEEKEGAHEEAELYFEGVFDAKTSLLEIYPLTIDPKSPNEFALKSPSKDIADLTVKIEFPRSRKTESIALEIKKDDQKGEHWAGKVPANKDIRFYVHLSTVAESEKKIAKIHLEKK